MQTNHLLGTKAIGTDLTPDEDVRLLCGAGFNAFFVPWDETRIPLYRAAADRYGLEFRSIHSACLAHRIWIAEGLGEAETKRATGELELASECGVPVLVMHPSAGDVPYAPTPLGLRRFERILARAEELGVTVAFENMSNDGALDVLLRAFPSAGYCYDTGHAFAYSGGKDFLPLYGDRIVHTHLHDNLGMTGPAPSSLDDLHLLPFDGKIDWSAVARSLAAARYGGILMSEVKYTKHLCEACGNPSIPAFYALVRDRLARLSEMIRACSTPSPSEEEVL